jgi:hypothetical protein
MITWLLKNLTDTRLHVDGNSKLIFSSLQRYCTWPIIFLQMKFLFRQTGKVKQIVNLKYQCWIFSVDNVKIWQDHIRTSFELDYRTAKEQIYKLITVLSKRHVYTPANHQAADTYSYYSWWATGLATELDWKFWNVAKNYWWSGCGFRNTDPLHTFIGVGMRLSISSKTTYFPSAYLWRVWNQNFCLFVLPAKHFSWLLVFKTFCFHDFSKSIWLTGWGAADWKELLSVCAGCDWRLCQPPKFTPDSVNNVPSVSPSASRHSNLYSVRPPTSL